MDKDLDGSFVEEFYLEAKEHAQEIEESLLLLEKKKGRVGSEVVDKMFRSMHSIKGAAGFLGFSKIQELAHIMETMLQMIRVGEIIPETIFTDALFTGNDLLITMIDDIHNSNKVEIQATCDKISSLIGKSTSPEAKKALSNSISVYSENKIAEFDLNRFNFDNIPTSHEFLYILKFDLARINQAKKSSPVSLVRDLLSTGIIVDSKVATPAEDLSVSLKDSSLFYYVLYATIMDTELVVHASGLSREQIEEVDRSQLHKQLQKNANKVEDKVEAPANAVEEDAALQLDTDPQQQEEEKGSLEQEKTDTVRIPVNILNNLMTLAGELVLVRNQHILSTDKLDSDSRAISQRLDIVTTELQESIMQTRLQPIGNVLGKLPRLVRDLSRKLNKKIEINITGNDVELDKTILEALTDPLTHMIRNCCDHGIESPEERSKAGKPSVGKINIKAYHEAGEINLRIQDDGKGIDPETIKKKAVEKGLKTEEELARLKPKEILALIMLPGFSTATTISNVSGRGVGMDVVATALEKLSGNIGLESEVGQGTSMNIRLPLTLAIIPCLVIVSGGFRYAIPQVNLEELFCLYDDEIKSKIELSGSQEVYRLRNQLLPLVRLQEVLDNAPLSNLSAESSEKRSSQSLNFAVLRTGGKKFGLIVDEIIGTEEIVVKPMHSSVRKLSIYAGATIMGDGKVAMILDTEGVSRHVNITDNVEAEQKSNEANATKSKEKEIQTVLLFQNGPQEQFAVSLPLIKRIERIPAANIEMVGNQEYITLEGNSLRILRLNSHFNVSPCVDNEEMFLLLPKHMKRNFGILVSKIIDTEETSLDLDVESYVEDGILGTHIIRDKMTLYVDIFRLIELSDPSWFEERRKATPPPQEQKHILLAEDTNFFQKLIKSYLEADHYHVTTADNGQEALELMNRTPFDLIVSDIEMPVMDGWNFMSAVRENQSFSSVPAIALTALDSPEDQQKCFESGFNHYETKLDRERLLSTVAQALG